MIVGTTFRRPVHLFNRTRKKKKKKKPLVSQRHKPENSYMKYWKVIKYWAKRTYDVTSPDLEMLFFLYDERLFTISKFESYDNIFKWDKDRFYSLKKRGWIHVWRNHTIGEARLYELTYKGKRMIQSIYKKMNGEEPIPTSERRNPVMRRNGSYTDKVYAMAINQFNDELKKSEQHPDIESLDIESSDH